MAFHFHEVFDLIFRVQTQHGRYSLRMTQFFRRIQRFQTFVRFSEPKTPAQRAKQQNAG
jgi:hypothetical protein